MAYTKVGPFANGSVSPPINAAFLNGLETWAGTVDTDITRVKTRYNELFFNVKDYGAVGDGSTDDTTAVQNAFTAALAATDPSNVENPLYNGNAPTVYFPLGTYSVNEITIAGAVVVLGTGGGIYAASVIEQRTVGKSIFVFAADTDGQSNCSVVENLTFKSLSGTSAPNVAQIKSNAPQGNSMYFRRCWFKTPERYAIWMVNGGDFQICECTFDVIPFTAIKLGDNSQNLGTGAVRIVNNTFFGVNDTVIEISQGDDVVIANNTAGTGSTSNGNTNFVLISGKCSRPTITGNNVNPIGHFLHMYVSATIGMVVVQGNTAFVITDFLKAETNGVLYNMTVVGNAIGSPGALNNGAFYAAGCGLNTCVISHNSVISGATSPRLFDMSDPRVTANIFNNNAQSGFQALNNFANPAANGA